MPIFRRRSLPETFDIAIVAVVTKALGAFLVLFLFLLPYYRSDPAHAPWVKELVDAIEGAGKALANANASAATPSASPSITGAHLAEAANSIEQARNLAERMKDALDQSSAQNLRLRAENESAAQENSELRTDNERLKAEIQDLQQRLKDAIDSWEVSKRWLTVMAVIRGCPDVEFTMYVRYEGKLVYKTGEGPPEAADFVVTQPDKQTWLLGNRYFDIGNRLDLDGVLDADLQPSSGMRAQQNLRVQIKLFHGVSVSGATYSAYIAAKEFGSATNRKCEVRPVYDTWPGRVLGQTIFITSEQPYAWLRRFTINEDGTNSLKEVPDEDLKFKQALQEFSRKQRELLCNREAGVCDGKDEYYYGDAHYLSLRSFVRFNGHHIVAANYASARGATYERCEELCRADVRCSAFEFYRRRGVCIFYDRSPKPTPGEDADSGVRRWEHGGTERR